MSHGYSQYIVTANRSANKKHVGVALGRACIERGISVAEVARQFNVSRQTVYNWFEGRHAPQPQLMRPISAYMAKLMAKAQ